MMKKDVRYRKEGKKKGKGKLYDRKKKKNYEGQQTLVCNL